MCQGCVELGRYSQQELDSRVLAGDMTVMPIEDRVAAGQYPAVSQEIIDDPETTLVEKIALMLVVTSMLGEDLL